jgi:synaptosomal-associated protein 25
MFNSKKSPVKVGTSNSVSPVNDVKSWSNPFDSDDEEKDNKKYNSSKKTSSERALVTLEVNTNPFDDIDDTKKSSSSTYAHQSADWNSKKSSSSMYAGQSVDRNRYKNNFRDSGGLENQSVQELESYAVYKAEETTESVHNCLKIAENIREDATKTLVTLHHQGEQITRSHQVAADIDRDLSRV